jgi:hypothetical protein
MGGVIVGMLALAAYLGMQDPVAIWIFLSMAAVMVIVLFLFHSMTVEIGQGELRISLGVGLIRKRVPLREIATAKTVRNKWWYGWGIRLTPHGWMFSVSGYDAVEITLQNGRGYRIGTDEPRKLHSAIESALQRFRSPLNAGGS